MLMRLFNEILCAVLLSSFQKDFGKTGEDANRSSKNDLKEGIERL